MGLIITARIQCIAFVLQLSVITLFALCAEKRLQILLKPIHVSYMEQNMPLFLHGCPKLRLA